MKNSASAVKKRRKVHPALARRRVPSVAAVGVLAVALGLAACGSSSGSQANSGSTSSGGASTNGSTGSSEVAAAQAFLKPYLAPPTKIALQVPLNAAPAKGKTLVWANCDAPQCAETEGFMRQATDAVGWKLQVVNYKTADPATLVAALGQALQYHPSAVSFVAQPYVVWKSVIPAYKKAGVAIIPENVGPTPLSATVPANIAGESWLTAEAKVMANWFISDSNGKGHALLFSIPQLGSIAYQQKVFTETVKDGCSHCKVSVLAEPYADVAAGQTIPAITSQLQRDASIKYVISVDQALVTPLARTLKSQNISGVKVGGSNIEAADEAQILSGDEAAGTPTSTNFDAWLVVDAALRNAAGLSQPSSGEDNLINLMLITPSSKIKAADSFDYPADWRDQFKKLWKVA